MEAGQHGQIDPFGLLCLLCETWHIESGPVIKVNEEGKSGSCAVLAFCLTVVVKHLTKAGQGAGHIVSRQKEIQVTLYPGRKGYRLVLSSSSPFYSV